jgi:ribonuclease BN (tRNA processing enzyme)
MGRLIFLGTGDPLNDERAQTSLALPQADGTTILFDTSSGTILLRQLRAAGIGLASIRHIFVSHRHFDHAGGLAPLLVALTAIPESDVTVHALPETAQVLHGLLTATIPGVEDWLGARLHWHDLTNDKTVRVGGLSVTPFAVEHFMETCGFRLVRGRSVAVFTADTRPCEGVTNAAQGAELLIHEVYGPDRDAAAAHSFGHSTGGDAGRAARDAGAQRLVLTHFRSSKFADPAALAAEAGAIFGGQIEAASDLQAIAWP